ncbi:MAG TPA: hypothetical protein VMB80_06460 [Candidatus Acidoferrum sp.]|nr:hypothetical protein [Candidatus Acidoferrum sp.]
MAGLVISLLICGLMDSAHADVPLVDQQIIVVQQAAVAITVGQSMGQSFTVGLAGSLTRIDFQLGRNPGTTQPLQLQLRTTIGDLPNLDPSALLFSGSIAAADVPILTFTDSFATSIDLSSAAPMVTPGEKLVVLLSSSDSDWYNWDNSGYFNSNPYPNGTTVKLGYPDYSNWVTIDNWDFGFRTWVTPVPEPAGLLPMGLLILGLGRRLRSR